MKDFCYDIWTEIFYIMLSNLAFSVQLELPRVQWIYFRIDFEDKKVNWRFLKWSSERI